MNDDGRIGPQRVWDLCEFYISSMDTARLLYADDGRPLGERYAAKRIREGVPFDMRTCPYSGSRKGRDMNVSALRSVQADWPAVLDAMATFRDAFMEHHGIRALDWGWLWVLGRSITSLPALYARTSDSQSLSVVPRSVASLFKPALGIAMTPERVMLAGTDPAAVPTVANFYRETEERDVFLTPDAACSGPVRQVSAFLDAALGDRPGPEISWISDYVSVSDLIRYGWASSDLELAKYRCMLALAERADDGEARRFGITPHGTFADVPASTLASSLDGEIARLGFSSEIAELARRDPFSLDDWCRLFERLMAAIAPIVDRGSERIELSANDVGWMIRHLRESWRSGLDAGIPLADVPIAKSGR